MTEIEFREFVVQLNGFYGLSGTVSPDRFAQWFEKVEFVPSAALKHIFDRITDEQGSIPRNLPMWIKNYFSQWRIASGKAASVEERTPCRDCDGKGFLWFLKPGSKPIYRYVARCARCQNWRRQVGEQSKIALRMKDDLIEQGYEIF